MKLTPITNPVALRLDTSVGTRIFAGNTMIYGDTGWRNVNSLFPEFDFTASPTVNKGAFYRRVGDQILIEINGVLTGFRANEPNGIGPDLDSLSSLPRVYFQVSVGTWSFSSSTVTRRTTYSLNTDGFDKVLQVRGAEVGNQIAVRAAYRTRSPWPKTLPGLPI